jgi:hypothetical protein
VDESTTGPDKITPEQNQKKRKERHRNLHSAEEEDRSRVRLKKKGEEKGKRRRRERDFSTCGGREFSGVEEVLPLDLRYKEEMIPESKKEFPILPCRREGRSVETIAGRSR